MQVSSLNFALWILFFFVFVLVYIVHSTLNQWVIHVCASRIEIWFQGCNLCMCFCHSIAYVILSIWNLCMILSLFMLTPKC
jgi:hypothetical protein